MKMASVAMMLGCLVLSVACSSGERGSEQSRAECTRSDALRHARSRYRVSGSVTIREINRSGNTCQASFVFKYGSFADSDVVYWTP